MYKIQSYRSVKRNQKLSGSKKRKPIKIKNYPVFPKVIIKLLGPMKKFYVKIEKF